MSRLTEKDDCGNWSLKGVMWQSLRPGQVITKEIAEKLYGVLWKLMEYEDTGLSPEDVINLNDFEKTQLALCLKTLQEERQKHQWIPVEKGFPDSYEEVLVTVLDGHYTTYDRYDKDYCAWDSGAGDIVAWMPFPEAYCLTPVQAVGKEACVNGMTQKT